jgi:hypothetical protein
MGLNIRLQSRYRLHQLLDRVGFHGGLQRRRLWFFLFLESRFLVVALWVVEP